MLRNLKVAYIQAGFNSISDFSKEIEIPRNSLSMKINEKVDFTATEARRILVLLRKKGVVAEFDSIFLSDSPDNGTEIIKGRS
jgi:hypothetical protein